MPVQLYQTGPSAKRAEHHGYNFVAASQPAGEFEEAEPSQAAMGVSPHYAHHHATSNGFHQGPRAIIESESPMASYGSPSMVDFPNSPYLDESPPQAQLQYRHHSLGSPRARRVMPAVQDLDQMDDANGNNHAEFQYEDQQQQQQPARLSSSMQAYSRGQAKIIEGTIPGLIPQPMANAPQTRDYRPPEGRAKQQAGEQGGKPASRHSKRGNSSSYLRTSKQGEDPPPVEPAHQSQEQANPEEQPEGAANRDQREYWKQYKEQFDMVQ